MKWFVMKKRTLFTAMTAVILLAGCQDSNPKAAQANSPLVVTKPVEVLAYQPSTTYIGRAEAMEDTAITAQVTGYLQARHFAEGQIVQQGQLLYSN